jgi:hypothetical protein
MKKAKDTRHKTKGKRSESFWVQEMVKKGEFYHHIKKLVQVLH